MVAEVPRDHYALEAGNLDIRNLLATLAHVAAMVLPSNEDKCIFLLDP